MTPIRTSTKRFKIARRKKRQKEEKEKSLTDKYHTDYVCPGYKEYARC